MILFFKIHLSILFYLVCIELSETKRLNHIQYYNSIKKDNEPDYNYTIEWLTQRVDHFSYTNNDTYQQRYLIHTDHWCDNCPIFLYLGCEGDVTGSTSACGLLFENAQKFKAMILFVEHRYYGQSIPYKKLDKNLSKFGYLTTEQAQADYAVFIQFIKQKYSNAVNSPIILFGASYCGMLVAWMRIKFPHLSIGGLASSAPLLKFDGMYDCYGMGKVATQDFKEYSDKCSQSIRNSWAPIRKMFKTSEGRKFLDKAFVTCMPLEEKDQDSFIQTLKDLFTIQAVCDYAYYPSINETCKLLTNPKDNEKNLLININKASLRLLNITGGRSCNSYHDEFNDTDITPWEFQTCTEMVFPDCYNGKTDMFEPQKWNFSGISEQCSTEYGVKPEKDKIPLMFGGKNITSATNIIFTNGMKDPWSPGGILETLAPTLIAIKISDGHHGEDLLPSSPNDSEEMKSARKKILEIFEEWLKDYYTKNKIKSDYEIE